MKNASSTRTLVIGGCGFIGSHLVKALVASGRNVTVLDRNKPTTNQMLTDVEYVTGDFSEAELIQLLVPQFEEVIHLAYASRPNTSHDDPVGDLMQNLPATVRLFDVIAQCGARLLLVSSGGTVYGQAVTLPIREDHPTQPISPYGLTKLTIEKYASLYATTKGLEFVCVRPANAFGEGQLPFSGQGFVATAIAMALKQMPITIFGNGTVRDYVYIDDLIAGMMVALNLGRSGQVYNIGSSLGLDNFQVVEKIRLIMADFGIEVKVEHAAPRLFDVQANVLDCTKIRQLGWKPMTNFDEGLGNT